MISRLTCFVIGLSLVSLAHPTPAAPSRTEQRTPASISAPAQPLRFEENKGQTDSRVDFIARGAGYTVFLTPTESVTTLATGSEQTVVRVALDGADERASVAGEQELAGRSSYMIGNDPSAWRSNIPAFGRVRYASVYPGVDLVYYGDGRGGLEYDFVVASGADPERIAFRVDGASDVQISRDGDLVIATAAAELRHRRPVLYQTVDGVRREVSGGFEMKDGGTIGFRVGAYDRSKTLTIDPVLSYSTYLGGSGEDNARAVAIDSSRATIIAGFTASADFPASSNFGGKKTGTDIFVGRLSPSGDALEFAFYIGGSGNDVANSVQILPSGRLLVSGFTGSVDFPTFAAAQGTYGGGEDDAVLFVIDPTGTQFVFSTYFGGSDEDSSAKMDVDTAGNIYLAGGTSSANLPVVNPMQGTLEGTSDGFVVKYTPAGDVVYATYLGGSGEDYFSSVKVTANGAAFVGMTTTSTDLPTIDSIDPSYNGGTYDGYVAKIAPSGTSIVYSTYLGGDDYDEVDALATDPLGALYVLGSTRSPGFPTVNAFQPSFAGGAYDLTVTKISPDGSTIVYSSFLGGTADEYAYTLGVNALGAAIVGGYTKSADFPVMNSIQGPPQGFRLQIVAVRVSPRGDRLEYSTFLGGSDDDAARGGTVDENGNLSLAVTTLSSDFPTLFAAQSQKAGSYDAGVVRIANLYTLTWGAPTATNRPPVSPQAILAETGDSTPFTLPTLSKTPPAGLVGYRIYRSLTPQVPVSLDNLYDDLPVNTTTAQGLPGGSYYVVTALYSDGTESAPSSVVNAGIDTGPSIKRVNVRPAKIAVKGTGFTSEVQVFLDGNPFVAPAKLVNGVNGLKVVQTGTLRTGETIAQYLAAHGNRAIVAVRNSDGGVRTFVYGL